MKALGSSKKIIVGIVALAVVAFGAGVAVATVTSTILHDTDPAGGPADEVRLRIVRSEFVPSADQPSFSTGWHTHPGPVIVQVHSGRFRVTETSTCRQEVFGPGETFVETPELPAIVTASKAVTWTTTFIIPANKPPLTMVPSPCVGDEDDDD